MKISTIIGARPQFVKASSVSKIIQERFGDLVTETIIHTGQHYDENMSKFFFDELSIPQPKYNLNVFGGNHGEMTGRMLIALEDVLILEKPDCVLIYGDTNSTLAAALAASKLHIPIAHVEAGLRSYNMRMPEEINRIVADRLSNILFCPTKTAVENLTKEGLTKNVFQVGDVMYDVALYYREEAMRRSKALQKFELTAGQFALATCHRAENTDNKYHLEQIFIALCQISQFLPVIFPIHPRTRKALFDAGLDKIPGSLKLVEPLAFLDMVSLEQSARVILTDSGGVQKEAFFYGVPCITIRDETEWVETVTAGWNQLVGAKKDEIIRGFRHSLTQNFVRPDPFPYGNGDASVRIIENIVKEFA